MTQQEKPDYSIASRVVFALELLIWIAMFIAGVFVAVIAASIPEKTLPVTILFLSLPASILASCMALLGMVSPNIKRHMYQGFVMILPAVLGSIYMLFFPSPKILAFQMCTPSKPYLLLFPLAAVLPLYSLYRPTWWSVGLSITLGAILNIFFGLITFFMVGVAF